MALPKDINCVNLRSTYKMPVITQEVPLDWPSYDGVLSAVLSQGFTFDSVDGPYRKYTATIGSVPFVFTFGVSSGTNNLISSVCADLAIKDHRVETYNRASHNAIPDVKAIAKIVIKASDEASKFPTVGEVITTLGSLTADMVWRVRRTLHTSSSGKISATWDIWIALVATDSEGNEFIKKTYASQSVKSGCKNVNQLVSRFDLEKMISDSKRMAEYEAATVAAINRKAANDKAFVDLRSHSLVSRVTCDSAGGSVTLKDITVEQIPALLAALEVLKSGV